MLQLLVVCSRHCRRGDDERDLMSARKLVFITALTMILVLGISTAAFGAAVSCVLKARSAGSGTYYARSVNYPLLASNVDFKGEWSGGSGTYSGNVNYCTYENSCTSPDGTSFSGTTLKYRYMGPIYYGSGPHRAKLTVTSGGGSAYSYCYIVHN